MKFLTAICHPDHLWWSLLWQNCHFHAFWNLRRHHQTHLSDWAVDVLQFLLHPRPVPASRTKGKWESEAGTSRPSSDRGPFLAFLRAMPWQPDAADFRMGGFGPTGWKAPLLECFLQRARGKQQASYPGTSYPGTSYPGILGLPRRSHLTQVLPQDASYFQVWPSAWGHPCLNLNPAGMRLAVPRSWKCDEQKVQDIFLQKSSLFLILLGGWDLRTNIGAGGLMEDWPGW